MVLWYGMVAAVEIEIPGPTLKAGRWNGFVDIKGVYENGPPRLLGAQDPRMSNSNNSPEGKGLIKRIDQT